MTEQGEQEFRMPVVNRRKRTITLVIEPWVEWYEMKPDTSYEVIFFVTNPDLAKIAEVEAYSWGLKVYGNKVNGYTVYDGDVEVQPSLQDPRALEDHDVSTQ